MRGIGRIESIEQLKRSVIKATNGTPVILEQVAEVKIGSALRRGDGLFRGKRALILTVSKQPAADTPTVVKAVEQAMEEIKPGLPPDVKFTKTFDQNLFIETSIKNVEDALRDGTIIVSIIRQLESRGLDIKRLPSNREAQLGGRITFIVPIQHVFAGLGSLVDGLDA